VSEIDPIARFNRRCRWAGALWLLLVVPASVTLRPNYSDFTTYYVGGLCVRLGQWDAVYPQLPADSPEFVFDPSTIKEKTKQIAEQHKTGMPMPYLQPAWNALAVAPLTLLPIRAAHAIWIAVLLAAMIGIVIQASRTFEACASAPSRLSGIVSLLVAFSPLAYRTIRTANVSAVLGFCIGFTAFELLRRDGPRAAVAIWVAGVLKIITAALVPLVLVMRRFKTLAWLVGLGIITIAVSVAIAGTGPFREYFATISQVNKSTPWPGNQSIFGFLLRLHHTAPLPESWLLAVKISQWLLLLVILALIVRQNRRGLSQPRMMFAATVALVGWTVIYSPLFWEHYHIYFAPLWGWMLWEATLSLPKRIVMIAAIAMAWLPLPAFPSFRPPEPIASYMLWSAVLMTGLALHRLFTDRTQQDQVHAAAQ
jgi:hypothetical protein